MLEKFAFLILGAILGAVFGFILPMLIRKLQKQYITKKKLERQAALGNRKLMAWLRNYHEYHWKKYSVRNELPFCEIGGYRERVPYLSKEEWDTPYELSDLHRINLHKDVILRHARAMKSDFEINSKLIDLREKLGIKIWNADTLYLEHISYQGELPIFHVKTCEYYANATNMIVLEDETIKAVKKNSFEKCKIRKQHYLTTDGIENNLFIPVTIGCLVVFALKSENGYEILLQTRSDKTITSNAVTSIVPTFGLSPFIGDAPRDRGLLYYNFLREYLEELHCIKETSELEKEHLTDQQPEMYYKWLYNMEHAKKLIECKDFNLYFIGFGFNLTNGNPNIGLLAKLDDLSTSQDIKLAIHRNWEMNLVRPVNLKSKEPNELGRLFSTEQLDPASMFFLSKAVKYLV